MYPPFLPPQRTLHGAAVGQKVSFLPYSIAVVVLVLAVFAPVLAVTSRQKPAAREDAEPPVFLFELIDIRCHDGVPNSAFLCLALLENSDIRRMSTTYPMQSPITPCRFLVPLFF